MSDLNERLLWRYAIQYGPEGEANYAWVYDGNGAMVCTAKTHHAISIVEAANALSSKDAEIEALRTRAESAEALLAEALTFDQKTAINSRFEVLFEEGTRTGKHGFYETVFEAMHTAYGEFLRARSTLSKIGDRT